ncbi:RNA polymerase sigma-70 factor, ECF subfamily [Chitinophaga eiseniae]|uniref:RNA polymerase sigma-70 factor, ECF subfamily n=1 Tax=Chitinophaga eiseniae TaxID=634771 RepID=A0A1T4NZT4_9BACT|nr:RNA polymerase sigma-70 factor [Chitinophaga eiseniae]SJZ84238.1 RNA polymerase sigma-70 factor, ECF subfamily [Chitinophaga eiseniae]
MMSSNTMPACSLLLLQQVAGGDEPAFRQLFDTFADRIYGVAYAYTKSSHLSEEIVQDVFVKIWLKRASLPAVKSIADYIFIISRNRIINELRRLKTEKKYLQQLFSEETESLRSPESEYVLKETRSLVLHAIDHLPPRQREVYQLNQLQGLRLGEVAVQLGLSRNTVRNHLSRAIQSVREYLHGHADEQTLLFVMIFLALQ